MKNRIPALFPLFASAATACGGELAERTGHVARDSAGIQVVENAATGWTAQTAWRIAPLPDLQIGAVDGEPAYLFSGISGVAALDDGSIVVADSRTHELRWFSSGGEHYATAGGEGGGPGEFGRLFGIWLYRGDSIAAYDAISRRVEIFDGAGSYARGVRLDLTIDVARFHYLTDLPHMAGTDENGGLFVMTPPAVRRDAGIGETWITRTFLRFDSDGAGPDTVVVAKIGRTEVSQAGPSMMLRGHHFSSSVNPVVGGNRIFEADPDRFEIRRYTLAGQLEAIFRKQHEPVRVTAAHVSAERSRILDQAPAPAMRHRMAELFDSRTVPELFPVARRIWVDRVGNVWLESFSLAEVIEPTWYVFDVDGRYLGDLPMPDGFRPLYVGSDFVLGVSRDEYDVPFVRRYRLVR